MKIRILLAAAVLLSPQGFSQEEAESEWTELDRELQGLELARAETIQGPSVWGYLRTNVAYRHFSNKGNGDEDAVFGNIDNLRLNLTGDVGRSFSYRVTSEARSGTMTILDAWARADVGEQVGFAMGRFRTPFLRSGLVEARDLLFIARTRNGVYWSQRSEGAMLSGDHGRLHWAGSVQNGADGMRERMKTALYAKVNIIGEPELPWEGAYHAGPTTRFTLGGAISNDDAVAAAGDGTAYALEGYLTSGRWSLQAEWMYYEGAYTTENPIEQRGSTSPWSVTGSFMLVPEKYELALRFDEFDDNGDPVNRQRQTTTFGLNRYILGHDLKWQLNYAHARKSGADDGPHEDIVALGLTLSF